MLSTRNGGIAAGYRVDAVTGRILKPGSGRSESPGRPLFTVIAGTKASHTMAQFPFDMSLVSTSPLQVDLVLIFEAGIWELQLFLQSGGTV